MMKKKSALPDDIRALFTLIPPREDALAFALAVRARVEMHEADGKLFNNDGRSARQIMRGFNDIGAGSTFDSIRCGGRVGAIW